MKKIYYYSGENKGKYYCKVCKKLYDNNKYCGEKICSPNFIKKKVRKRNKEERKNKLIFWKSHRFDGEAPFGSQERYDFERRRYDKNK